jgi:integrase
MAKPDRVKGIHRYRHPQSGLWYCYHRKTGKRIVNEWRTAAFYAEVAALDAAVKAAEPLPGSLGLLIKDYRTSPAWSPLKPKTRLSYERALTVLAPLAEMPVKQIDRPFVFALRDKKVFPKHGRWMANYVVTVLGLLLAYAKDHGLVSANPLAEKVKKVRAPKADAPQNRPWSGEECRAVLDAAPPHLRLPIALAMFAGFRKEDVLTMTKAALKDGGIRVRTSKRGTEVMIPVHPALQSAIEAQDKALRARKGYDPVCEAVQISANSFGSAWTESGFNSSWSKLRNRLLAEGKVAPGLTFHGLRHTLGTRLKEAGASDQQIADILGQKSLSMARLYSEGAETPEETRGLVLKIDVRRNKP